MTEKLDLVFESLRDASMQNVALGFAPENVEAGSCPEHFAHENNTLVDRFQSVVLKPDSP